VHYDREAARGHFQLRAELSEVRTHQRCVRKVVWRQERLAPVNDRHRESERPGKLRDGDGIVSGAEDDQLRRRSADLEEYLAAANTLRTRRRVRGTQADAGVRHRLAFYN